MNVAAIRRQAEVAAAAPPPDDRPERLNIAVIDFDAPQDLPKWAVRGIAAAGFITTISAAPGTGKSFQTYAIAAAAATNATYLGREVPARKVLVFDENGPSVARSRLGALGVTNTTRDGIVLVPLQDVRIGSDRWDAAIRAAVEEHRPDLTIVDTVATHAELPEGSSDEQGATAFMTYLTRLAVEHEFAVILTTHTRKGGGQNGEAMMGSIAWQAQSELHLELDPVCEDPPEVAEDGSVYRRKVVKLAKGPKDRQGWFGGPEEVVIESVAESEHGPLIELNVYSGGPAATKPQAQSIDNNVIGVLRDAGATLKRKEIADRLGMSPGHRALGNSLKRLRATGRVLQAGDGKPYSLPEPKDAAR